MGGLGPALAGSLFMSFVNLAPKACPFALVVVSSVCID